MNNFAGSHNHDLGESTHRAHSDSTPHVHSDLNHRTRRDFFRTLMGGTLAGASILELAHHRAAWARAAGDSGAKLFEIEKAADGIYFAQSRPAALVNCNASIFVGEKDVVVVDAHSKPSAARSLIGQIKREVTDKPVRYVVNSHFHWDHTQGNHAYRAEEKQIDFIASNATKKLMEDLAVARLKASLDTAAEDVEKLKARIAKSTSAGEKAFCADQIRQIEAYRAEMKNYTLELPTITFDKSYVLKDAAHELHIEFHGHAHTAGDVVIYCPQKQVVATGDMIHGVLPFIADGFPQAWPSTIHSVGQLEFTKVLPGHSVMQTGHTTMNCMGNYIQELRVRVADGKKAGQSVEEMQKRITVASLKSLASNGYGDSVVRNINRLTPHFGASEPLQSGVSTNVGEVYKNLDRV